MPTLKLEHFNVLQNHYRISVQGKIPAFDRPDESRHEPLSITKRGRPVAIVMPVATRQPVSIIGALRVSVLHYDDPFTPAAPAWDWNTAG